MAAPRPIPNTQPVAAANGSWFGGMGDWFSNTFTWGQDPQMEQLKVAPQPYPRTAPEGGAPLPPPNIPQMPPLPAPPQGSGTSTPWGGPPTAPQSLDPSNANDPYKVVNEYTPSKPYSFMDNPGASDALVAFGAAMLKAPDFKTGLGDAALAVNQVARQYRMPTEQDYARAKQLGMLERIKSGKGTTAGGMSINRDILYRDAQGQTWFDAVGPSGEAGLYNQDTGQFTTQGVPGLTRDVYDYGSNKGRRAASKDADVEAEYGQKIPAIAANVVQFDQLYQLAADPATGIDSNFATRVARQLETLLPGSGFGGLDANNITEFNNRIEKAALDYASGAFKGQGQVTENERLMIKNAVGQPGTLTKESAMLVFRIMRDAEKRKLVMYNNWKNDPDLRERYGNNFSAYQTDIITQETMSQLGQSSAGAAPSASSGAPAQNTTGTTSSGIKWELKQ